MLHNSIDGIDVRLWPSSVSEKAESLTGWSEAEGAGRPLAEVFSIVRAATREPVDGVAERVLIIVVFPEPSLLLARDGIERPVDDSAAPIRGSI